MEIDEETLLSGLSSSESETDRFAAAFWEKAWPKLQDNGWEKVVRLKFCDVAIVSECLFCTHPTCLITSFLFTDSHKLGCCQPFSS